MQLPEDFIKSTKVLFGEQLFEQVANAIDDDSTVSIRMNPNKWPFADNVIKHDDGPVAWCEYGRYLKSRPTFTFDPLMHAGCYYVQEASSMFLAQIMRNYADRPCTMLDLCAAPGGKSMVARTMLPEGSLLISNEPMRNRAQILAENMTKFGHPYTIVTNNFPKDFKRSNILFDIILTDVPCSGEGMFRKDQTAIDEWSLRNVDVCWQRQRDIISDIWDNLKPGGILIYATCTYNTKENEENVKWICDNMGAELLSVATEDEWHITSSLYGGLDGPVYRFLPGRTRGEGLFMAALRKDGDDSDDHRKYAQTKNRTAKTKIDVKEQWLMHSEDFEYCVDDNKIIAFPKDFADIYHNANKNLKVLTAGITIGEIKGKDVIPDESLALSTALKRDAFPTVELAYEQAIAYLHKEAVTLPADTPRGFVLVTYKNMPLGFEKNIGNRANNLYPQEWRIKSGHMPETNQCIIE